MKLILSSILFFISLAIYAQVPDVLTYDIYLDFVKAKKNELSGKTTLKIYATDAVFKLKLTESLNIDSIYNEQQKIEYRREGEDIMIKKNKQDTLTITIAYHGKPAQDDMWGGFFFKDGYAYNYGVGMAAKPPVFGRAWFPCHDSFTDKARFSFHITTPNDLEAISCGLLYDEHQNENSKTYHWKLKNPIPTYLASIAVGDYELVEKKYKGIEKEFPLQFYVEKGRTDEAQKAVLCIEYAFNAFEYYFGPYQWSKIGFVSTPFRSGAMEHATNIAFPSYCDNGSCDYLLIHELAHSWFGNLLTCKTAADMWINEGFASYLESLYEEYRFGKDAATKYRRNNHRDVLLNAHRRDGGYLPVYDQLQTNTYGATVYDKGASVVHTLRAYIGDSLFFNAFKRLLSERAFDNISTEELRTFLEKETNIKLNNFFDTWVYSKGFPHFSLKSFGSYPMIEGHLTSVNILQRLHELPNYAKGMTLEIMFWSENGQQQLQTIEINGAENKKDFLLPFKPLAAIIDPHEKIMDATLDEIKNIKTKDKHFFEACHAYLDIKSITDSSKVCVQFSPIAPLEADGIKFQPGYWKVDVVKQNSIKGDICLIDMQQKANVKLYRRTMFGKWEEEKNVYKEMKRNVIVYHLKSIKSGEYALGLPVE